jgi:hypothetical protein
MRRLLLLALAAAVVTIPVTAVSAGASPASRPFKGSMSGTLTFAADAGCLFGVRTNPAGTGTASHLGMFTYAASHCAGFTVEPGGGKQTMVAANGDKLFADYETVGPPVIPPSEVGTVYDVPVAFTITGGTGRFADATGGGYQIVHITFMGLGAPVWPFTSEWQGTIGY